jgi:glycosyltransferase involved in cell wall biosynthesis
MIGFSTPYHQRQGLWRRAWSFLRFALFSLYILYRIQGRGFYVLVVTPPPTSLWVAAFWRMIRGQRYGVEVTDAWPMVLEALGWRGRVLQLLLRKIFTWSYRKADFLATYSPGIAEAIRPMAGGTPLFVSHNGTAIEMFRRVGAPPYLPFRLVYAGTFGHVNNLEFLMGVARALLPWRGIEVWLIGDGSERSHIEKAAKNLSNLRILSPCPPEGLRYILSQCHVGISTVLPLAVLHTNGASKFYNYLANGLVVGLNYGGWQAEILERYGCGFSAESIEAFVERVLFYYWHRGAWWASQARGRLVAEQAFDLRAISQALLEKVRTFGGDVRAGVAEASACGGELSDGFVGASQSHALTE